MLSNKETAGWVLAMVAVMYLLVYTLITLIDEDHCRRYGAEYHSTSLGLTGYCSVSGVKVPAEWMRRPGIDASQVLP